MLWKAENIVLIIFDQQLPSAFLIKQSSTSIQNLLTKGLETFSKLAIFNMRITLQKTLVAVTAAGLLSQAFARAGKSSMQV